MAWAPSHHAPRDRKVWLFLPCASFTPKPDGTVTDVAHKSVVGEWDEAQSHFVDSTTRNPVYPSLWSDAAIDGPMPDNPLLEGVR